MPHLQGGGKLLLVSQVLRWAWGSCRTFPVEYFERCPEVLLDGASCPATCPEGLYAEPVSCQENQLSAPSCLEVNTSTSSTLTISSTSTSTATSSSTTTSTTATMTSSTNTATSSTVSSSKSTTKSTTATTTTRSTGTSTGTNSTTTSTSTTEFNISSWGRCVIASSLETSCPRYMMHLERCSAICQPPLTSLGHFTCLDGRFFGSSGCVDSEATDFAWRGLLLAAALRLGLNSLQPLNAEELIGHLRRSLAVCLGVSVHNILRPRVVDFTPRDSGESQVIGSELELEFEVALGRESLNQTEVSAAIFDLEDPSSPIALLFRNMLKGYFDIQVIRVDVVMAPLSYSGSLLNFTSTNVASVAAAKEPDGSSTTVVSGVVLSMAVIPVVAAFVRLVLAEKSAGDDSGAGGAEPRKSARPKRKVQRRSGGSMSSDG